MAARAAHAALTSRLGPLDGPSLAGGDSPGEGEEAALVIRADEDVPHGLVPEALSLLLAGRISLQSRSLATVCAPACHAPATRLPCACHAPAMEHWIAWDWGGHGPGRGMQREVMAQDVM